MTPARADRLNRFLVEQVMGWTVGDHPEKHGTGQWFCEYGEDVYFTGDRGDFVCSSNFDPLDEFADCEPLMDKIERDEWTWEWSVALPGPEYLVRMANIVTSQRSVASAKTRTEALCLAIARAYGWKEDASL